MNLAPTSFPVRLARRRWLLLGAMVATVAAAGTAVSALSLSLDPAVDIPWQAHVATWVTAAGVSVAVLTVWGVLRGAGRAAWAVPVAVLASAAPVVARAGEEASWVLVGRHAPQLESLPYLAALPGVTAVVAVLTARWLWPTPFPPATRGALLLALAGWAVVTGVDAGLGIDVRLWVVDPYGSIGVALVVTAALVVTTGGPAPVRWRRALLSAVPVTALVLLPDVLDGALYGNWVPSWWSDELWRPAVPVVCAFAGMALGLVVTAPPAARRRPA